MIYVVGFNEEKVMAFDGAHHALITRVFGTAKEKMCSAVVTAHMNFEEDDDYSIRGYKEYYVITARPATLINAVAKACTDTARVPEYQEQWVDSYAPEIEPIIMAYTTDVDEISYILEQIKKGGTGEQLFKHPEETTEIPF